MNGHYSVAVPLKYRWRHAVRFRHKVTCRFLRSSLLLGQYNWRLTWNQWSCFKTWRTFWRSPFHVETTQDWDFFVISVIFEKLIREKIAFPNTVLSAKENIFKLKLSENRGWRCMPQRDPRCPVEWAWCHRRMGPHLELHLMVKAYPTSHTWYLQGLMDTTVTRRNPLECRNTGVFTNFIIVCILYLDNFC